MPNLTSSYSLLSSSRPKSFMPSLLTAYSSRVIEMCRNARASSSWSMRREWAIGWNVSVAAGVSMVARSRRVTLVAPACAISVVLSGGRTSTDNSAVSASPLGCGFLFSKSLITCNFFLLHSPLACSGTGFPVAGWMEQLTVRLHFKTAKYRQATVGAIRISGAGLSDPVSVEFHATDSVSMVGLTTLRCGSLAGRIMSSSRFMSEA